MNSNIPPLLIVSCDKYEPFWTICLDLIFIHWKDSPKIYFMTEEKSFADDRIVNLKVGKNDWSTNLETALQMIPESNVMMALEDFFLNEAVDLKRLETCVDYFHSKSDMTCLRLWPQPQGQKELNKKLNFYEHLSGHEYRISTQLAIWKKTYLQQVIVKGESPWEFEMLGTARSTTFKKQMIGTVGHKSIPVQYLNGVIRGKLTLDASKVIQKNNILMDSSIVKMRFWENYYWTKASNIERHAIDFLRHRFGLLK